MSNVIGAQIGIFESDLAVKYVFWQYTRKLVGNAVVWKFTSAIILLSKKSSLFYLNFQFSAMYVILLNISVRFKPLCLER